MAEETEMDPFVVHYCNDWIMTRKTRQPKEDKKKKGAAVAGAGAVCGLTGFAAKASSAKFIFSSGALILKAGAVVVASGGSALMGFGALLFVGGVAYALSGDATKARFLDECKKSHFSRGMAKADWQNEEKALKASIQVLDGLDKRCPDLTETTRSCIEIVSHAGVTPHARSICRYVVETCVSARSEYEYDEDETFRRAFQESRNEIKRCWTELNSYQPSDGLGIARRR